MKKIFKLLLLTLIISVSSKAQIKLVGNITTNGVASYPTHIDSLGKGGYMSMPTLSDRNSIPTLRRKLGMLVYVQANDSLYKLASPSLDNTNWITMGLASVLKLANDSLLLYTKIKDDSTTLANRIGSLSTSVSTDISNAIASSGADVSAEVTRATAAEAALGNRINTDSSIIINRLVTDSGILRTLINSGAASITAEVTRATAAETALGSRINADSLIIINRLVTDSGILRTLINTNTSSITAEVTRATAAETNLASNLAAEVTRATAAETALGTRINADSLIIINRLVADSGILRTLINTNTSSITAEVTRATAAESTLTTKVNANTSSITTNTNDIAANLAIEKADSLTLVNRIKASEQLITINTNNIAANLSKQQIDSALLKGFINVNTSTINTNLLKEQTDSLLLAARLGADSVLFTNQIIADSSILRGLINTNASDIALHTTQISNNTANISQNSTDIAANTLAINTKVAYSDVPTILNPYLKKEDTISMLSVYRDALIDHNAKVAALITDSSTLITRFGYKENVANKSTDVNGDGTSDTKYPSVKSVKDYVDNAIVASTPDATTTAKGKIQLSGDLTGIAAAPIVKSVGGSSSSTIHTAELLANAATDANTNDALVKRDASGNFSAGIITAALTGDVTGNASTATKLAATKSIYGNAFDGTADLNQAIAGTFGGTGVDNGSKTITLGGNILTANSFTTAGNYSTTLTSTGVTDIILPTTGTIATLAGTETLTNKTIANASLTGIPTAPTPSLGTQNSQIATTAFVANFVTNASVADASPTIKGKLQLAGDLTGTADLPTVKTFAGVNTATMATINTTIAAATSSNTANSIVKRDASGNFVAGIITANLTGNATTATTLAATKSIYGNAFDGSADLTQAIAGNYGGTGVNNGSNTITLGGNILTANSFTTAGNYSTTLTSTGVTNVTLPTTGTIATLAGTETLTNKTIVDVALTGVPTAPTAAAGTSTAQLATTAFVTAATPDAASSVKGIIQLAGDLAGTAIAPTVATVGGSTAADIHAAELLANGARSTNTNNAIVKRDASGNFSAGTITANVVGTSTNVTGVVAGANGGTGINNTGKTITLGGNINTGRNFTTTGTSGSNASDVTLKTTATTNLTLPTTGVLATLDGVENLTNKTINGLTINPAAAGFTIAGGTISKTITLADDATVSGTNTGDQTITLTGDITGVGTGTFSTTMANSGVTAGTYGGATSVPTITVDAKGRITNAASTTITGVSSIGSLLESAKIIVGDVNNQAAKVDMTGDISIDNNGTTTIGVDKVVTQNILNSNVTYAKIQNVSANKVLGNITTSTGRVQEISTTGTGNVVRAVSPSFAGVPKVPTAAYPSNDSTIASTAYVSTAISNISASSVTGVIAGANGGTGVNNTGKTITLGRNLTTTGTTGSNASDITFKTTGTTVLTLPTSGTLATMADISGSSVNGQSITGVINPINGGTGVANDNNNTLTLGGAINTGANFTTTGTTASNASNITLKTTAASVVTLPTAGVLATLDGAEALTNKTIDATANTITGISNTNIDAGASIDDTKLATISTAGKVENTATTATASNAINTIVARDANGGFAAGTITAALTGNATTATKLATGRLIYGNSFDGTAAITAVIGSGFGGTGNGFTKFTGPATAEKTFTLPNANATILTSAALVTVAQGGTGAATATQNFVFAGPATGSSAGAPSFRALTAADLPSGSGSYIGNTTTLQANSNFNISGNGVAGGSLTAANFIVPTATSAQFLKGDGSLDATTYAAAGANTDITSLAGLTTALSVDQGGTGSTTRNFVDLSSSETIGGVKAFSNDIAVNNINIGYGPGAIATNTSIGYFALKLNTSGYKNVAIGQSALAHNLVGYNNTAVGFESDVLYSALTNATAIGYQATVETSNTVQLGNANVTNVKTSGNITAGTVTYAKAHNSTANQVLSIDAAGNTSFKTIDGAGANLTNGKILVGNTSNLAAAVNLTGDVTMTNAGVVSITSNAVTYGKIQNMGAKTILGNKSPTLKGTPGEIILGTGLNLDSATGILTASVSSGGSVTKINPITLTTTGSTYTSTVANSTSSPTINLNIPLASQSGTTAGLLSNADYASFYAKQDPLTLGTGVQTLLSTPSSANLLSAVTDATGTGSLVFATSPVLVTPTLGAATATSLTLSTPLAIASGGIGAATAPANLVFAGPATGTDPGEPSFRALTGADLPAGSGSYISNQTSQQASSSFNISGAGVVGGQLSANSLTLSNALSAANGGTGRTSLTANAVLIGNGTGAVAFVSPGVSGNVLTSNGSAWVAGAAPASGVSAVGTIATSSNVKGATISGTSITLTPADATNGGIVTSGVQTFAGTKTFSNVNVSGNLVGSTVNSSLSGFNAALVAVNADFTISAANATTYNGKVLVCSGNTFTITFDSTVPVGFSCMILQSDNNTVSFAGTNNRYNYSATSGIYAIATAMSYASGSVLLTGDLQ